MDFDSIMESDIEMDTVDASEFLVDQTPRKKSIKSNDPNLISAEENEDLMNKIAEAGEAAILETEKNRLQRFNEFIEAANAAENIEEKEEKDKFNYQGGDFLGFCRNELSVKTEECNKIKSLNRDLRNTLLNIKKGWSKCIGVMTDDRKIELESMKKKLNVWKSERNDLNVRIWAKEQQYQQADQELKLLSGEIEFEKLRGEVHRKNIADSKIKIDELKEMLAKADKDQSKMVEQKRFQQQKVETLWQNLGKFDFENREMERKINLVKVDREENKIKYEKGLTELTALVYTDTVQLNKLQWQNMMDLAIAHIKQLYKNNYNYAVRIRTRIEKSYAKKINKDYALIDTLKESINRFNIQGVIYKNMKEKNQRILGQRKEEMEIIVKQLEGINEQYQYRHMVNLKNNTSLKNKICKLSDELNTTLNDIESLVNAANCTDGKKDESTVKKVDSVARFK